jgi:hypothetical protein
LLGDDSTFTTVKVYTSLNQQSLQSFIMPEYSIEEYADMHFVYGECSGNAMLLSEGMRNVFLSGESQTVKPFLV